MILTEDRRTVHRSINKEVFLEVVEIKNLFLGS